MTNTLLDAALGLPERRRRRDAQDVAAGLRLAAGRRPGPHVRVGTTPSDVVYEEDTLRLLRYHRETPASPARAGADLLRPGQPAVHPRPPAATGASFSSFSRRGFDVYLIDWGVPSAADRSLTARGLRLRPHEERRRPRRSARRTAPTLNLLGYCMGGTMSAMFTALYPGAGQDADPDGRADRLRRRRLSAPPLDAGEVLRRRQADRRLRQLPGPAASAEKIFVQLIGQRVLRL